MSEFPGFPPESQTWDFPTVLNGYVHILSGAEFKVLWYVLRHTYGWQKTHDAISLNQFQFGIKRKNGTYLDKGTGLSRPKIIEALQSLKKKGFITIESKGKRGGTVNYYAPKIEPVKKVNCFDKNQLKNLTGGSKETLPEPVKKVNSQSLTNLKYTITQQAEAIYSEYPKKADRNNSIKSIIRLLKKPPKELQPNPISILKKCINNYKAYIEQEGTERRYVIQSNNFWGKAERYKEFINYEKPKRWDEED